MGPKEPRSTVLSVEDEVMVVAFPDGTAARAWYTSPAYQALLPLRRRNAEGEVFLIDGVGQMHRATDILSSTAAA